MSQQASGRARPHDQLRQLIHELAPELDWRACDRVVASVFGLVAREQDEAAHAALRKRLTFGQKAA